MSIPTDNEIFSLLARLNNSFAREMESQWVEFKPWEGPKESLRVALEYVVCFANAQGGIVVFGVVDDVRGRTGAIKGVDRHNIDVWKRGIFEGQEKSRSPQNCAESW
ncbi:MAG: ATP-binding protein [Elusimicrobiota bacterium]